MNRPNIFEYANRELSQDAIVCWLLACLHSSDPVCKEIGLNFIRFIFSDDSIEENEIILEPESPHKQYCHMDVYAIVYLRGKIYPIIFENKTDTYLHDDQLKKYCLQVADWMSRKYKRKKTYLQTMSDIFSRDGEPCEWGSLVCVYMKTGYVFSWQKAELAKISAEIPKAIHESVNSQIKVTIKEIYLEDMMQCLENMTCDYLLEDYRSVLERKNGQISSALENVMKSAEDCGRALDDTNGSFKAGCDALFCTAFCDDARFQCSHQHWASKRLFSVAGKDGGAIDYCYRFECCKFENGEYAYAFNLQQYREEKKSGTYSSALEYKIAQAKMIQKFCEGIVAGLQGNIDCSNIEYRFEKLKNESGRSYNGQMIMKVFIVGDSTPERVCCFVRKLADMLRQYAKTHEECLGGSVTLSDYLSDC